MLNVEIPSLLMSEANRKSRQPIWLKLSVLSLLLFSSGLTITACRQSEQETEPSEVIEQETENKTSEEPLSEAERKYQQEGIDTTDDDDVE